MVTIILLVLVMCNISIPLWIIVVCASLHLVCYWIVCWDRNRLQKENNELKYNKFTDIFRP